VKQKITMSYADNEGDLGTRTLVLENKKFYIDVQENQRGRFIKVAEISPEGRKNQILMNFSTAAVFNENLVQFVDFALELRKHNPDNLKQGELLSKVIYTDDKKYHMDLKENSRGRFLKVSEKFPRGHSRFQVIIPADGLEKFQVNLEELLDEYDDGEVEQALAAHNDRNQEPARNEDKKFYFDIKSGQQGRNMTISEVKGNFRNSIAVPEGGWENFLNVLSDYMDQESGCKTFKDVIDEDLASRTLMFENKKFHLDMKENQRGRFIKIAEVSQEGRKNQIMMSLSTAGVFNKNLSHFVDFYHDLDSHFADNFKQEDLKSEVMYEDDKKYHMDLRENARGRFLKVSETFARGNNRDQIFIPADGMVEMQQNLQELIGQFDKGNGKTSQSGAQNKHVRIEGTNYYFDAKTNQQGRYMSISEVKGNSRSSILVPQSSWDSFYDGLDESIKKGFQSRA